MTAPKALDLFCGGFGAGHGLQIAGFDVTGVDMVRRRSIPPGVNFMKAMVEEVLSDLAFLRSFDFIHASPPCKENTRLTTIRDAQGGTALHRDMLVEVRQALDVAGVPYMLENVEGAAMRPDVLLCGSMFDLHTYDKAHTRRWLQRHRLFELGGWGDMGVGIQPEHHHWRGLGRPLGVYGSKGDVLPDGGEVAQTLAQARELIGAPWMSWESLTQAIPPAYTAYLGQFAMAHVREASRV